MPIVYRYGSATILLLARFRQKIYSYNVSILVRGDKEVEEDEEEYERRLSPRGMLVVVLVLLVAMSVVVLALYCVAWGLRGSSRSSSASTSLLARGKNIYLKSLVVHSSAE
jgi:hypothetical protein